MILQISAFNSISAAGTSVPVIVVFRGQLTPEELKANVTLDSSGRFDIPGEEEIIKSYGGSITRTFPYTNAIVANLPQDNLTSLKNDPRIVSVDIDYPSCVIEQGCPPASSNQTSQMTGNINNTGLVNSTSDTSTNSTNMTIPVIVLFKNQLTDDEIKANMTLESTGRFDIAGEINLVKSFGGNNTSTFTYLNAIAADLPEDKMDALRNDPRVASVERDIPGHTDLIIPPNGTYSHFPNGTVIHYPNPYLNSTSLVNSTMNDNTNPNLSVNNITNHKLEELSSPLKQMESGTAVKDVQCKEGFVLLIKTENNHPSCVKPTSITRLLAHGWVQN